MRPRLADLPLLFGASGVILLPIALWLERRQG